MPPAALIARSLLLRSALRPGPAPRGLKSGPPQSPVGLGETAVGLLAMFTSILAPAAWVLGNIQEYKKREE